MSESYQPVSSYPNKSAVVMYGIAIASAFAPGFYIFQQSFRIDAVLAGLLLILPSALVAIGAICLLPVTQKPEVLTICITGCNVAKAALVFAYLEPGKSDQLFAWLSLLSGFLLLGLIYILTSWIMNAANDAQTGKMTARREGVINQLLRHRFLSISGLVVAYLHLVLFLGLALAFQDRAADGRSIERQVTRPDLPGDSLSAITNAQEPWNNVHAFAFLEGSTSLRCTAAAHGADFGPGFYDPRNTYDWRVKQLGDIKYEALTGGECGREMNELAWNLVQANALKNELSQISETTPFDRFQIAVVAHATDSKANPGFSSNYEMSRARAEQVQAFVNTLIAQIHLRNPQRPPINVEWQLMPAGTGNMYLTGGPQSQEAGRVQGADLKRALTTEVQITRIPEHLTQLQRQQIEHGPKLQLLDYLYFMITAGTANDLAPACSFAQFVAAAGHISQLFLLVVTFNVILAFRRQPVFKTA